MKLRNNLKYHFNAQNGWINDPNGLVFYKGKYHIFYQYDPTSENASGVMCWGHAVTEDFLNWEHLPIALKPDREYDKNGCWSGTAVVKDDVLYLFYASVYVGENDKMPGTQTVSIAYSTDGINFKKYEGNPVIKKFHKDGGKDFRDPAILKKDGKYYLVMATGNPEKNAARLLVYQSENLFDWEYIGIMAEWGKSTFCECPSFVEHKDKYILSTSVCIFEKHYFSIMYGDFDGKKFNAEVSGCADRGPDQYAGQIFSDSKGRAILISWIPGWHWKGVLGEDIGCLSVPKEVFIKNGKVYLYPVEELQHLLKSSDSALKITDNGFIIERKMGEPVIYKGEINDIAILRDDYIIEVFINGGEQVFTAVIL